ncbi:MAG: phosphoribosylglycinamide formyltransferase [Pseudomonadales bacterium]|nr:phosphoribosylglycinamide formyltransferase [Pseudomonadales bacterium]NRA15165.1 phosphoribosylglycinamide formyltransferase [Oceanospirillaceae bacterium]
MKKRIAVLISGSGTNLQAVINAVDAGIINAEIVLVISNKADAYGITRAQNADIETLVLQHTDYNSRLDFDLAMLEQLEQKNVDLVVLAGFMRILSDEFVRHFSGRMLNIHPSLLPKHKGLHTHQRALEAGDTEHGCSVHFVTAQLDDGPVALQAIVPVTATDREQQLQHKVHLREHIAYPKVIAWFCADRLRCIDNKLYLNDELLPANGFKLPFDALD